MISKTSNILPWLLVLPFILLMVFISMFYSDFPEYIGTKQSWLSTANIVNGFVTPMLTLATIILLFMTWNETRKTLRAFQVKEELELISRVANKLERNFDEKNSLNSMMTDNFTFSLTYKLTEFALQNDEETDKLIKYFAKLQVNKENHKVNNVKECTSKLTNFILDTNLSKKDLLLKTSGNLNQSNRSINFIICQIAQGADFPNYDLMEVFSCEFKRNAKYDTDINLFNKLVDRIMEISDESTKKKLFNELMFYFQADLLDVLIKLHGNVDSNLYIANRAM
ncbi:hypothetical protein AN392_01202 [Pseudoalteromonas sp. P1-16-1b]|uniref:hypothetical protein n=1 Tax=Pseudoalteromonas sp. P1-16-1b TaxID=1723757 RepID=UPI0006D668E2|nr:hypothetical protein [Pseudoalteromonas sp. P1-16-1b]KPZ65654.1 hypothetical protein AN392_01202 [Pseudoalteromonas sp. P1-16-1b]